MSATKEYMEKVMQEVNETIDEAFQLEEARKERVKAWQIVARARQVAKGNMAHNPVVNQGLENWHDSYIAKFAD